MNIRSLYLSGPMTGIKDWNFPAFNEAATKLRERGYDVVNPAELNPGDTDWHTCLRADIKALCDCDGIALMPGWMNSKGAHLEVHVAHRLGLQINTVEELLKWAKTRIPRTPSAPARPS